MFPRKEMKLNYAYPILIGYKNNLGVGYKFNFEDPFSLKSLDFSISFTPNQWKNGINDTGEEIDKSETVSFFF